MTSKVGWSFSGAENTAEFSTIGFTWGFLGSNWGFLGFSRV